MCICISQNTTLITISNMLYISFGIRTDNTEDPLVVRALELAMEFMDLTGKSPVHRSRMFN